jgi:type II secretory pathway component GspD/PulD (secretin)
MFCVLLLANLLSLVRSSEPEQLLPVPIRAQVASVTDDEIWNLEEEFCKGTIEENESRQVSVHYQMIRMPHRFLQELGYANQDDIQLKYLNGKELSAFFEVAQGNAFVNVMQTPKITLFDAQEGAFRIGDEAPLAVTTSYRQVGEKIVAEVMPGDARACEFKTTPRICADGKHVELDMAFEQSFTNWFARPSLSTCRIQCKAKLVDGGSVVLAHFPYESIDKNFRWGGVPVLGELPLIGSFFQGKVNPEPDDTLVIIATARILNEEGVPGAQPTSTLTPIQPKN